MTRRVIKWFGFGIGGLVIMALLALVGLYILAGSRLNKTYNINPAAVAVPTSGSAIERGRQQVSVRCTGCHGEDLAGTVFFNDPALGRIPASNLTSGRGGVGSTYSNDDWVRAIRHGVRPDGKPLLIMPAEALYWLSDDDLGAIIAYVKSVPPVDNDLGRYSVTPMAHVLVAAGAFGNVMAAEIVDHNGPRPSAPSVGVTPDYGEYLMKSLGCQTCHGAALAGAQPPEPGAPFAPNITPGGNVRNWSEGDFLTAMRARESRFMPYKDIGRMTDNELKALWLYLKSLPAKDSTK